ncbi:hypothetical protein OH76DRAFT_649910 [Lentinus brumalis]|uniref:Uncharacterized protein n=1 Tax=Lentinus brumalis TaxID=2498619 RepID=A0A371D832_9APHY|nr:hypothetical protein OH76DRAFT_649910 [Polyporus brumalis]
MVGGEGLPNLQFGTSDELRPCGQLHEEPNCAGTFICISLDGRRGAIDHAILLKDCRRQRAAAPRCTHGTFPVGRLAGRARRAVGAARASEHLCMLLFPTTPKRRATAFRPQGRRVAPHRDVRPLVVIWGQSVPRCASARATSPPLYLSELRSVGVHVNG